MANPDYSPEHWDDVHSPELTDQQLATGRSVAEVWHKLVEVVRQCRWLQKAPAKAQLTPRHDREVVEAWQASGLSWQSRMNDVLRKGAGL